MSDHPPKHPDLELWPKESVNVPRIEVILSELEAGRKSLQKEITYPKKAGERIKVESDKIQKFLLAVSDFDWNLDEFNSLNPLNKIKLIASLQKELNSFFQKMGSTEDKIAVDGIFGPETINKLNQALRILSVANTVNFNEVESTLDAIPSYYSSKGRPNYSVSVNLEKKEIYIINTKPGSYDAPVGKIRLDPESPSYINILFDFKSPPYKLNYGFPLKSLIEKPGVYFERLITDIEKESAKRSLIISTLPTLYNSERNREYSIHFSNVISNNFILANKDKSTPRKVQNR